MVSVWVCEEDLFPEAKNAHLRFGLLEVTEGFPLHTDIRFDVLQLSRWKTDRDALSGSALGSWFYFFNEAERWREVPELIDTGVMEEAMEILNAFRTDVQLNHLYKGRLEAERVERGRQRELEDAQAELTAALLREAHGRAELERERAEQDAAPAELAALRAAVERERR